MSDVAEIWYGEASTPKVITPSVKFKPLDHCKKEAAEALARRLEKFWRSSGARNAHLVKCIVKPGGDHPNKAGYFTFYDVRSNLYNGLPPR